MEDLFLTRSILDISDIFEVSVTATRLYASSLGIKRSISESNKVRYRKHITYLTPVQEQLVYGSLLGDACLFRQQHRNHFTLKVFFAHGQDQLAYLKHKKSVIGGCKIGSRPEGSNLGKQMFQFGYSNTQGLLPVESIVSPKGHKEVNERWLQKLELPGIAYWYQDDASLVKTGPKAASIRWYTNSFSAEEIRLLILFIRQLGFSSIGTSAGNYKPEQIIIVCHRYADVARFIRKIKPFAIPCLSYKFQV